MFKKIIILLFLCIYSVIGLSNENKCIEKWTAGGYCKILKSKNNNCIVAWKNKDKQSWISLEGCKNYEKFYDNLHIDDTNKTIKNIKNKCSKKRCINTYPLNNSSSFVVEFHYSIKNKIWIIDVLK